MNMQVKVYERLSSTFTYTLHLVVSGLNKMLMEKKVEFGLLMVRDACSVLRAQQRNAEKNLASDIQLPLYSLLVCGRGKIH